MEKDIKISDLTKVQKLNDNNLVIELGVGLESKGDFLFTLKDFNKRNSNKWRYINLSKDKLRDFKTPRDLQEKIHTVLENNKIKLNALQGLLSAWYFFEWIEVNDYGYETNARRFIAVQKNIGDK
jgi:hypothetical protein